MVAEAVCVERFKRGLVKCKECQKGRELVAQRIADSKLAR